GEQPAHVLVLRGSPPRQRPFDVASPPLDEHVPRREKPGAAAVRAVHHPVVRRGLPAAKTTGATTGLRYSSLHPPILHRPRPRAQGGVRRVLRRVGFGGPVVAGGARLLGRFGL